MERRIEQRVMLMNMVLEGITLMSKGRSPAYIRETLKSFMARYEDEIRQ
jgi:chemotaxis protein MotA